MQFSLNEVKNGGLLDDPESYKLKHILEEKMKRLTHSPTYINPTKAISDEMGFEDNDESESASVPKIKEPRGKNKQQVWKNYILVMMSIFQFLKSFVWGK